MTYGEKIQEAMRERGLNAHQLADKIDVTPSTIYSIFYRGGDKLSIDLAIKIAHALGMTVDELLADNIKPDTLAAHFDGDSYTDDEIREIMSFAEYVRSKRK